MDKPIDIEALEKHVDARRRAGLAINDYPKFQKATNALLEAVPALLAEIKHLRERVIAADAPRPQRQDSLSDQLCDLLAIARREGMYDAEDALREYIKEQP